ncbi:hypothetical protein Tco_0335459 [Tanacetum coccineum]
MLERLCGNEYYWLLPISKGNPVNSIVGRLILVASTYFVWQERNKRLFAKGERRVNELCEVIAGVVRLKLTTTLWDVFHGQYFSGCLFCQYHVLSKTVVYTDHSALKYLFSKEDAKPRLIRLENLDLGTFAEEEITDEFPDEHLAILKAELNNDEPCSFTALTGGHHSASITRRKVYESGFYRPSIFKDAKDYVMKCDACQRSGNISSRSEMPQNNIQLRDEAYENTRIYKERTKKWHDSRLRGDKKFKGDKVLIFNSRFKMHPGKLKSKWLKKYHDGYNNVEEKEVVDLGPREGNIDEYWWRIYKSGNLEVLES